MAEPGNQQPTLIERDQWLRDIISTGEMPFLGLYTKLLDPKIRQGFRTKLSQSRDPLAQFLVYLGTCPALSLTYLTLHVCEGFGTHGTFEVYPFLQDALQLASPLTSSQKEKLWSLYRKASIKLGLSVSSRLSGTHYMVDEYLRQSGVPLPYVADLTHKMIRYAQLVGIPDDDDPVSISTWQSGLSARLLPPFSKVAQRAVSADDNGFYARLFLKLLKEPAAPSTALSDFELNMSRAIHDQETSVAQMLAKKGTSLCIPQVVWRDGQLVVELPAGEGVPWLITVGNNKVSCLGRIESHFVPFDQPLPPSVEIESNDGRGLKRKVDLWEDEKNNRLLIFSGAGLFIRTAKLNSGEPLLLEPGAFQLVLRFVPDGYENATETIRTQPALHLLPILLEPGQKLLLSRGPAELEIKADSKPLILWDGPCFKGVRGNDLYASRGLKLRAIIPEEFLDDEVNYYVRLSVGQKEALIPLKGKESGDILIESEQIAKKWGQGVFRLLAEIHREGIQRPLVRSSIMVWFGLERVVNRSSFYCSTLPANLLSVESDNLRVVEDKKLLSFRNEDNRFFRMVFDQGSGKRFTFTTVVPGIFLQLQDHSQTQTTVRSIKKGTTLSVSWGSRCDLEIYSTANGTLRLGEFKKRVEFSNCGCKRIPLSSLIEHLGPASDTLQFIDEATSCAEDLVRLVAPHEVLSFSVLRKKDIYKVIFSLTQESAEINLIATDMLTGFSERLVLRCNGAFERGDSGVNGWLSCGIDSKNGHFLHELQISLDRWPDGAWILEFDARINGRWGGFSNSRGDRYSAGFILLDRKSCSSPWKLLEEQQIWGRIEKMEILQRLHGKLMNCFALESWHELIWIQELWEALLTEFEGHDEYAPQLLEMAEHTAPESASATWVPMISLSARFYRLYALPVSDFSSIRNEAHKLPIKCLTAMSHMENGLLRLFNNSVLNQIFAMGFSNIHEMLRGADPKQFNMKTYEGALKSDDLTERLRLLAQDDWQPGDGDYLGALHYLYAMERFDQIYQNALPGNDYRRGKALYLSRSMKHYPLQGLPAHLGSGMSHLGLINTPTNGELTVHEENILLISQFLSLFAKVCRWEVRSPGSLDQFVAKAKSVVDDDPQFECILGFLLYVGKDLFCFYLMLWEAVLMSDCTMGEHKTHVRKQSASSLQYS